MTALAPVVQLRESFPTTGSFGNLVLSKLALLQAADVTGRQWANVTWFSRPKGAWHDDVTDDYFGPVVEENADYIVIEVHHSQMTFPKSRSIIRRAGATA